MNAEKIYPRWAISPEKRRVFVWSVAVFVAFAALAMLRLVVSFPVPRNSDDANNFLAGVEMGRGNWNLHGWFMAPDSFYTTDVLGIAVLTRVFGVHPLLMQGLEAVLWAMIVMTGILLAARGRGVRESIVAGLAVITLLAFTVQMGNGAMQIPTMVASHAFPILLALLTFWMTVEVCERDGPIRLSRLALLGLAVVMGSIADPTYVVMGCLPVLVTCFMRLTRRGRNADKLAVLCVVLSGLALSRLIQHRLRHAGGFEQLTLQIDFAGFNEIIAHTLFSLHAFAENFGADFSGKPVTPSLLDGPYIFILRFPFLLLFFLALAEVGFLCLKQFRRWPDRQAAAVGPGCLDQLLFTSVVLGATAAIVTTAIVDGSCVRYFLPATVAGAILLARTYAATPFFALYVAVGLAGSVLSEAHILKNGPGRAVMAEENVMRLSNTLRAHDLHHGYAGYWQSSIITALTKEDIRVLALTDGGSDGLRPMRWFANQDWYSAASTGWRGQVFFVARASGTGSMELSQETVIRDFGTPVEILHVGPYLVDVYNVGHGEMKLPRP